MTEFECFIFLVGVATGIAMTAVVLLSAKKPTIDHSAPKVRTRIWL